MAEPVEGGGGGGIKGALTRPIGPLPTWGWVTIAALIIVGYAWWHNRQTQQAASSDTANASQVPQFVNQVYTGPQPPEPPDMDHKEDKDDRRRKRKHPTHHKETGGGGHGGGGSGSGTGEGTSSGSQGPVYQGKGKEGPPTRQPRTPRFIPGTRIPDVFPWAWLPPAKPYRTGTGRVLPGDVG